MNRGNQRQRLFEREEDYGRFISLMEEAGAKRKGEVKLWGYCLMSNHWHLAVEVERMEHLSQWMHGICNRQVRMIHRHNQQLGGGHIYQGRHKSFPIQNEEYLYRVLRYVEANPVRAGLVERGRDWVWSSLSREPIKVGQIPVVRPGLMPWERHEFWESEVDRAMESEELQSLRRCVVRGTPYGEPEWVRQTALAHGMESTIRPRRRPRVERKKEGGAMAEVQTFLGLS